MRQPLKQTEPPLMPNRIRYFMEHPEQFNIAMLASNEMERGDGLTPLAKIPDILGEISKTIEMLAKKYPDDLIGTYKARKINEILSEIKFYYLGSGYEEFLELIQEPEEVKKDGETYVTGMSYSDV